MKVNVEFVNLIEVGELQPPREEQFTNITMDVPAVPRFKDRIRYGGVLYFVNDVIYDDLGNGWEINIKAVRKVRQ